MQMYRVKFAMKAGEGAVNLGDVLVCANSNTSAKEMVAVHMGLPRSGVEMTAERVKPSIFTLSRREVANRISSYQAETVPAHEMSRATFPGVTEARKDEFWFEIEARAQVRAEDESAAIVKLSRGIEREMSGERQKGSVRELDIVCDRKELHPKTSAVERNGMFKSIRVFQGGDART